LTWTHSGFRQENNSRLICYDIYSSLLYEILALYTVVQLSANDDCIFQLTPLLLLWPPVKFQEWLTNKNTSDMHDPKSTTCWVMLEEVSW